MARIKVFYFKDEIPQERFNIVLVDLPWRSTRPINKKFDMENHYPTMSLDEIKSLKVPTCKDCVLFLWVAAPKFQEALEVMKTWGFKYQDSFTWDKVLVGKGDWVRDQHELLLLGTKGSPQAPTLVLPSIFKEKLTGYNKKPQAVYEIIESMFPDGKYLELFAGNKRDNWVSWG